MKTKPSNVNKRNKNTFSIFIKKTNLQWNFSNIPFCATCNHVYLCLVKPERNKIIYKPIKNIIKLAECFQIKVDYIQKKSFNKVVLF